MSIEKLNDLLKKNLEIAGKIAGEGIVLLENRNNILPLDPAQPLAVFGRGQLDTKISGSGSGATDSEDTINIISGLQEYGFNIDNNLLDFYQEKLSLNKDESFKDMFLKAKNNKDNNELPWWYEFWGKYNPSSSELIIDDQIIKKAVQKTDTAVIVISRVSGGEECDRRLKDDYYLSAAGKRLIEQVCYNFSHVIVLLNTAGVIDLNWLKNYPAIEGVLHISLPGQVAGRAVAGVLSGKLSPSGKLVDSYALSYQDYPSSKHFSFNKEEPDSIKTYHDYGLDAEENGSSGFDISPVTVYQEEIYIGYRYFDTFGIDIVYPFGYGLSYTEFGIEYLEGRIDIEEQLICLKIKVNNIGEEYSGKEVVQVYISKPDGLLEKPYQELVGYKKTKTLATGESQILEINFSIRELSAYDQKRASYIIEKGYYYIRVGNSSRNTRIEARIFVPETVVYEGLSNQLEIQQANQGKIDFLSKKGAIPITYPGEKEEMESAELIATITTKILGNKEDKKEKKDFALEKDENFPGISFIDKDEHQHEEYMLEDVYNGNIIIEEFVSRLSVKELAVLCNGYGNGQAFGGDPEAPKTITYDDGIKIGSDSTNLGDDQFVSLSPAIERQGIPSLVYKDGPAGIGLTAWPVETMMAASWNDELLYAFGDAVGRECKYKGIDVWLGPAINLHRNPIAGRNFEYYSEDPLISGKCAVAVTRGVMQNHNVTVSAKHFVLNEQETYRRGHSINNIDAVDSIIEERVVREIYLKPFEMLVKNTEIRNIMTSFNKINGTFATGNEELNINILRDEWGYKGYLVTDWGDMDIVVDGADAVAAGNDVIMPGGPPVIKQVFKGFDEGRVNLTQLRRSAINFLNSLIKSNSFHKYIE